MDFGRDPYTKWCRVFDSPDAPLVRVRWFFSDAPCIESPSAINNRVFDPNREWEDVTIGELADWEADYRSDYKRRFPALQFGDHICHPEWLANGEPWPVPDSLPPTEYGAGSIPTCCDAMCEFDDCLSTEVNAKPASYAIQYATPAKDATDTTPCKREAVYVDYVAGGGDSPAAQWAYCPLGRLTDPVWSNTVVCSPALVPESRTDRFKIDGDNEYTLTQDATGQTITTKHLGVTGTLTLKRSGDQIELCGTNLVICADLMPGGVIPTFDQPVPAGTDVLTATLLTASDNVLQASAAGTGVVLPGGSFGVWSTISVNNPNGLLTRRVYAGYGGAKFYGENGAGPIDYVDLAAGEVIVVRQTNPGRWTILARYNWFVPSPPAPAGTVTSVAVTAPASGISVSGSPITAAGTFVFVLTDDLAALEALSGTNTIYYRSGVSTWSAVTVGSGLSFTGGTLASTVIPGGAYVKLSDTKPAGTQAGVSVAGIQTRTLNTEDSDATGICTLASNQFTLAAGTYRIKAVVPAFSVQRHVAALYNATAGAYLLTGTSQYIGNPDYGNTYSEITGRFTVAAGQALEIRHETQLAVSPHGLGTYGSAATFASVYTVVELWRES